MPDTANRTGPRQRSPKDSRPALPRSADRMADAAWRLLENADGARLSALDAGTLRGLAAEHQQAVESQRDGERLLAIAAHELRHPLQLMRLTLAQHLPPDHPAGAALNRYIDRMARLVDDLIDVCRPDPEHLPIHPQPTDLFRLLAGLVADYRPAFDSKGVRLALDMPRSVLSVHADPDRLIQVFCNLLDNALKSTASGGTVAVEATAGGGRIEVHVRDTGHGPAASAMSGSPRGPDDRRLGIGLAVARRILAAHEGELEMRTGESGRGTDVVVTLPAEQVGRETGSAATPGTRDEAAREIEAAFNEMPGLTLSTAQAARLFSRDAEAVSDALETLAGRGALRKVAAGYARAN